MRIIFAVFVCALLCMCTGSKSHEERKAFNYNEINGLSSMDPAAASNFENIWPVNQVFNGLVELDDSLIVRPSIAKSYSISADGRTYTFRLRNDVWFHDNPCFENSRGRKVVARDFLYSFQRLFDSRVSSAAGLLDCIERNDGYNGFGAPNDSTFTIRLNRPFRPFISILTMKFFSVIPHEALEMYGAEFRSHPVGTGPFMFRFWEEGTKLVLHRNPLYFEKDAQGRRLPYLDAVTVSFIKDKETAFMELLNGKFDMVSGADAFNANEVLTREGTLRDIYQDKFFLQKETFLKTDYIGIYIDEKSSLVRSSPLKLRKIRQALNFAFDRAKLIRYLRSNIGVPATAGFIPAGLRSFDSVKVRGFHYDPLRAMALLEEAGFPRGKGLPEITIHTTEPNKEQMEFIQSQFAICNIRVQVSVDKPTVLRQAVNAGEYLMFRKSWFCDYADEENFMSLFYSKNFTPLGVNFFHYSSARFDSLYDAAQSEEQQDRRSQLYQEMDRMLVEDAPFIPVYYDQVVRLVRHDIKGLKANGMNLLNLKHVIKN